MAGRNFKPGQCSPHPRIRLSAAEREIMARRFEKAIVSSQCFTRRTLWGRSPPPTPPGTGTLMVDIERTLCILIGVALTFAKWFTLNQTKLSALVQAI